MTDPTNPMIAEQQVWRARPSETPCPEQRDGTGCVLVKAHPKYVKHLTRGGLSW